MKRNIKKLRFGYKWEPYVLPKRPPFLIYNFFFSHVTLFSIPEQVAATHSMEQNKK